MHAVIKKGGRKKIIEIFVGATISFVLTATIYAKDLSTFEDFANIALCDAKTISGLLQKDRNMPLWKVTCFLMRDCWDQPLPQYCKDYFGDQEE
jgi:hypothetical protein